MKDFNAIIKNITFIKYLSPRSWGKYYLEYIRSEIFKDYIYDAKFKDFGLILSNGRKLVVKKMSFGALREVISLKCYDFDFSMFPNGFSLFDGGANLGYVPCYYDWLGLHFTSVCVEPDLNNFVILKTNVVGLDVVSVNCAVDSKNCVEKLNLNDCVSNSLYHSFGKGSIDVKVVPFDSFNVFDVVKLDVEGSEHNILLAQENWKRCKYLMIEFHGDNDLISKSKELVEMYFVEVKTVYGVVHYVKRESFYES